MIHYFNSVHKIALTFLFLANISFGQAPIGTTEGASIVLEDNRYEFIFQNIKGQYNSFYMSKGEVGQDGLANLSKYVTLLFEQQKGDFLLQFDEDSVFLTYENGKVSLEIWRKHDSDNKISSKGFTLEEFQELFGDSKYVQKKL